MQAASRYVVENYVQHIETVLLLKLFGFHVLNMNTELQ